MEPKKDIYLNSPPIPEWMKKQAETWNALVKAGVFVYVPMTEDELLPDPDYGL